MFTLHQIRSAAARLDELDWTNPMLVRDLRQGLRSPAFTGVFLIVPGGLTLLLVESLTKTGVAATQRWLGQGFDYGLPVTYYILFPLIAYFSLIPEFDEGRLDLLRITHLDGRGIVVGKWLSLCTQGLLVASTLLPFLVLRYFLGGYDVVGGVGELARVLWNGGTLLAVALAFGSLPTLTLRLGALGLAVLLFAGFSLGPDFRFHFETLIEDLATPESCMIFLVLGPAIVWICLRATAQRLEVEEREWAHLALLAPILLLFMLGLRMASPALAGALLVAAVPAFLLVATLARAAGPPHHSHDYPLHPRFKTRRRQVRTGGQAVVLPWREITNARIQPATSSLTSRP